MIFYILFFIFFAIISVEYYLKPFRNKDFIYLIILLLGFFAGLRAPGVDLDYNSYQGIFDQIYDISKVEKETYISFFEPGFLASILFFREIFKVNYVLVIMLFYALFSVFLKIKSINRLSQFPYLVILFYFSHYFFLHEMTQIRIGLASGMFFIALIFYLNAQRLKFALIILISILFHYSAILFLVILLFDSNKFNKYIYGGVIGGSLILGYLKLPLLNFLGNVDTSVISGKFNNYADMVEYGITESINVFNVITLFNIIISLYFIFFIPKATIIKDRPLALFLKCNILSIFLLCFLSGVPSLAFRFSELFGVVSIFVYASLVKYLPFGKLNILATILFAGLIFYTIIFHIGLVGPYSFNSFK